MSRIGKLPIKMPPKVKVAVDGLAVTVEGPKGRLERTFVGVGIEVKGDEVIVSRPNEERETRAMHGLARTLLANMVDGVSTGFERKLELYGVGFRAQVSGSTLNLNIGFSHPILVPLPDGVTAEWKETKTGDKQGEIYLRSIDKDLLGRTTADIRALRPPEPYKGKGIKYAEETIRRKQGKTGAA